MTFPDASSPGNHTLLSLLARNAERHPRAIAMRERDLGIWQEYSWLRYRDEVLAFAAGLEALGFAPGEPLLVIGDNRPLLYIAMLAAALLRGFPAPVYAEMPAAEIETFSRAEKPRFALAEDQEQVDKLLELRGRAGWPRFILYDDPRGLESNGEPDLLAAATLAARGRERLAADPNLAPDLLARARPEDGAVLLHSSGTTGRPKAILLQHREILAAIANARAGGYFAEGEEHMAYLPIAWIGDFVFSLAAAIALRFTVSIPERQETVLRNLREIAPTLYFASPRSWDNLLTHIRVGIAESTALKRRLFDYFMTLAIAQEKARLAGETPSLPARLLRRLGETLVYGPVKDQLGLTRARHPYTAGEAIGEDTFLFFRALGLNLKQFYGQTENCALTAAQRSGEVRLHTVGRALPGIELRIAEDGEILLRGASVFTGYVGDDEATGKALVEGWLHTGDAGYLEPDGQLVVLGRVGEVVHTRAGERFIPGYIENRLKFSPYIRDVAVLGAGRDFLTALICIDDEAVGHWAQTHNVPYASYAELSQRPEIYALVAAAVRHVNTLLPEKLRLRRFVNLRKAFDPDDGEVTRTRKLRRSIIDHHYAPVVEALYGGADSVDFAAPIAYESGAAGSLRGRLAIEDLA